MKRILTPILILLLNYGAAAAAPGEAFTLTDAYGREWTLPEQQQGIGVYLFWASWCPYCRALMPHLQSLVDQHGGAITVFALNFRDRQDPRDYVNEQGFDFIVLPDADPVAERWGVHATPGLVVIDRNGRVRFNLYDVVTENPPGYEDLNHTQRAARRAPYWAARMREALNELLAE